MSQHRCYCIYACQLEIHPTKSLPTGNLQISCLFYFYLFEPGIHVDEIQFYQQQKIKKDRIIVPK